MNKLKMMLCLCICIAGLSMYAQPSAQESNFIKVDQFGYLPDASKVAVISDPQIGYNSSQSFTPGGTYQVREWSSGNVVFSGNPQTWNGGATHSQSGDRGWWFDFSSVTAPGTYYLYDTSNGVRSYEFEIRDDVYNNALRAATRMFYYNRSGIAKVAPYAESNWQYNGAAFQQQDSNSRYYQSPDDASTAKDLSGGWFDAGDFNKYITFANRPVHDMLWAYRENPTVFADNWNIPESGNNVPDVLDELKWELDWMFKMNNSDGSTHIKMGSVSYNDNTQVPPDVNTDPRYYGPTCSSASIAVAGMFAHAAKVFQDVPGMSGFAQELRNRAETSWNYVLPALNNNQLNAACDDQVIKSGDADWAVNIQRERALAAAIYLFELTGNNSYNQYIINNINDAVQQISNTYWDHYMMPLNDALLLYTTLANNSTTTTIKNSIQNNANGNWNGFYGFNANADLYRAQMPGYGWGSNREISAIGALNQLLIKYGINSGSHSDYQLRTNQMAHYIHGVNPLGMTYLTNMYNYGGDNCANEMYHDWFKDGSQWNNALTSNGPAPGYIVGGANEQFSGSTTPPQNQPPAKSYLDYNTGWPDAAWEISEPSITYQGAYVRLIAYLATVGDVSCPPAGTSCNDGNPNTINDVEDGNCNCYGTIVQNGDCELLANNDFDNDTYDWGAWACTASYANSTVSLTGITAGANVWDAGFSQSNLLLEQGKSYTVTFTARADNNRPVQLKVGLPVDPWTNYVYETVNLSTTMTSYTYNFTMTDPSTYNTSFDFFLGTNSTNVYIESAGLEESDCGGNNCPPEGTTCDDGNPATTEDTEDGNCNCIGTPCPAQGTACNDNDPSTTNDEQDGFCNCVGTPCPAEGTTCNDGNPNTTNDVEDGFCNCTGTPIQNEDCELLANHDFDNNTNEWFTWGSAASYGGSTVTLNNITTGNAAWYAGFKQEGVILEQGKNYTINFRAKSDANNRPLTVKAGLAADPWTAYFREDLNISTTMQNYTYSFTMTNATDTNSGFEFMFGTNAANIYIESASVQESDCEGNNCPPQGTACNDGNPATTDDTEDGNCNCAGTPCPTQGTACNDNDPSTTNDQQDGFCNCVGTPCPAEGTTCNDGNPNTTNDVEDGFCNCTGTPVQNEDCELLANNDFDSDTGEWFTWGSAASYGGSTVTLNNITTGDASWYAGFKQEGVILEQGKNYTISFRAKSDANNRPLTVKAGLAADPWTAYFREDLNISTTMQNYTYSFTMTNATDTNSGFEFMFGTNAANIYIESASVQESNCGGGNNCPPQGTACNDGNPATIDDIEDGNCNCAGTSCPTQGTACNDNDPSTTNDKQDGFCNCVGTPCPTQGTTCDDGNPNTINDVENGFCSCTGTPVQNNDCNEFSETFDGAPDAPSSFYGDPNWAIFITERDEQYTLPESTADHGPNCEPPVHLNPSDTYETTHTVTEFEDAVYVCRNHLMTNIHGLNFGIINMTPDHLLDFSEGEAVISVDVSTWDQAATSRDWWTITLQNPDDFDPLAGMQYTTAKNTLWIETGYSGGKRYPTISMSDANFNKTQLPIAGYTALEDLITPSKTARTTFELRVRKNYVKFGIKLPDNQGYHWWVDTGVDASGNTLNLTWDKAMVMLGHYSYNPRKDGGGMENTWHWDNVSMSPTVPITVIGTDARYANSNRPTLNLDAPAPANAQLVLTSPDIERIGNSLEVSFNGGATWNNLTRVINSDYDPADTWSPEYHVFKTAIPAGTTQLTFNGIDNTWQDWMAKDVYVISDTPTSDCNSKQDLGATPDIKLYPNPAKHSIQLTCDISENTQADIQVYDAFGKLVRHITDVELHTGSSVDMNVSQFPAGMYFCTVKSGEWQAVKKFVIAR